MGIRSREAGMINDEGSKRSGKKAFKVIAECNSIMIVRIR